MRRLERIFEKILWQSRLIIVMAVIASVLSALLLVAMGSYDIILLFGETVHAFRDADSYVDFHKTALTHIISALDAFLIATVLIIFGIGLYELFISKLDQIEKDTRSSRILVIHSLDQLKEKLAKVIIMVLIVTFFKFAVGFKYATVLDLLALGGGIFLIALSAYLSHKSSGSEKDKNH